MQKYRLKDFEFAINPNTWNTAQDLVQSGAVRSLREVEKNFWVASVDAPEAAMEVEVIITPQRVKAYTCECWSEGRRLICPHIAAVLLKLRQFLEQKQEERRQIREQRRHKEANRLTVQDVLQDVPYEDLVEFIKNYARRDRDFTLAFKTWFAGQVKGPQNPFLLILESAIPGGHIRSNEWRRIRKTLDDLILQLEMAEKEGHLQKMVQIATAIVEKVAPLSTKNTEQPSPELLHYCHAALQSLKATSLRAGSPEWQDALWHTLCRWAESSWLPDTLNPELIGIMYREATRADRFRDIEQLFDQAPSPVSNRLIQLYAAALAERDMPEAVARVLDRFAEHPHTVPDTIRLLQTLHLDQAALLTIEHALKKGQYKTNVRRELEDRLIQLAERLQDRPRLLQNLQRRFIETGSMDIFLRLKQLAADQWPVLLRETLQELQARGDRRRLAALFAAEKETDALESLLDNSPDTDLLELYTNALSDAFLHRQYSRILQSYLQDHFGKPAAMHVRQTLGGLMKNGKGALARQIVQELIEHFNDRPSLPEELAELFPGKKKAVL